MLKRDWRTVICGFGTLNVSSWSSCCVMATNFSDGLAAEPSIVSGPSESLVVPMSVAATGDARLNEYSAGESFSAAVSGRGRTHSTARLDHSSRAACCMGADIEPSALRRILKASIIR